MSICPNHGGYTGDSCKKCVARLDEDISSLTATDAPKIDRRCGPVPLTNPELKKLLETVPSPPAIIEDSDKLTLVKLENASLKSFHAMQNAQAQFQGFAKAMFEKYKVKPGEYTLDMEKLEFVVRGM